MSVYESPCHPCKYNSYVVDEFGDCLYDECSRPEGGICWIEEWMKESEEREMVPDEVYPT